MTLAIGIYLGKTHNRDKTVGKAGMSPEIQFRDIERFKACERIVTMLEKHLIGNVNVRLCRGCLTEVLKDILSHAEWQAQWK